MSFRLFDFDDFLEPFGDDVTFSMVPMRLGAKGEVTKAESGTSKALSTWMNMNMARMDVVEGEKECTVKVEMAGIPKDAIQVHFDSATNCLTVEAEKREEKDESDGQNGSDGSSDAGKYHYSERRFGRIARTIKLPDAVDGESVKSSYADGLLQLTFAKKPAVTGETRKKIEL